MVEDDAQAVVVAAEVVEAFPQIQAFLLAFSQAADAQHKHHLFQDYRERHAANTFQGRKIDLQIFGRFLAEAGLDGVLAAGYSDTLVERADGWRYITHGMISSFIVWMKQRDYALQSVNRALSTMHVFAGLASSAKVMPEEEYQRITRVHGYNAKEMINVEVERSRKRLPHAKKPYTTMIGPDQADHLKHGHPPTLMGYRNAVLMCLLIDHGLRVSEALLVSREQLDLETGILEFYRPKVKLTQRHQLTLDTLAAIRAYLQHGGPPQEALLRVMRKGDRKHLRMIKDQEVWLPLTRSGAFRIVKRLSQWVLAGVTLGEDDEEDVEARGSHAPYASPHDFRHYWATNAVEGGTTLTTLMVAGGWSSLAMPQRYINQPLIANANVTLKNV